MRGPADRGFQVAIVGGGPAGAALAFLLAGAGMRALLLHDGRQRPAAPRETLLAAGKTALERAGLWHLAVAAARPDPFAHGAIWGSAELLWREDEDRGLLLERGPFDAGLREAAAARGATVVDGAQVVALPAGGAGAVRWRDAAGREHTATAERCVLATGRRPRPELLPLQEVARGPETAALTVVGGNAAATHAAVVEAVPEGWWWWIGDGAGGGAATLLCDTAELAGVGSRALVSAARRAACGPVAGLEQPRLVHGTRATARVLRSEAGVLLLGDAAATIDPLASQGVEKAFCAADHAAAVLRTARDQPQWWAQLLAVHARWEHGLFAAHAPRAAAFLAREQRFRTAPFWRRRHEPSSAPPMLPAQVALWPSGAVQMQAVLARADDRFTLQDGALRLDTGDTLTHVGYVPVAPLLAAFAAGRPLDAAVEAAGRDARLFVLPPSAVRAAALELWRRGWLTPVDAAAASR